MANPITMEETSRGVSVAWRLFLRDGEAARLIDDSYEGVIKSFWCAAIVLPFYFLYLSLLLDLPGDLKSNYQVMAENAGLANATAIKIIAYAVGWVAWPLVMHRVAPMLDRDRHFFRYIVAYNWMSVVTTALLLGYGAALAWGLAGEGMAVMLGLGVLLMLGAYHWFVIRVTLDVGGVVAAGLVVTEFALASLISDISIAIAL